MYEALCRQDMPIDTKAQSRLYCYYKMDRPYLRLASFKVEIIRQNPLAVLFHDIISDEEARIIQLLAKPKAYPNHPRAKSNIKRYEDLLENTGVQRIDMRRDIPLINNVQYKNNNDEGMMLMYEALCRQGMTVNAAAQLRLYCYYKMDRPYLRLAAFKVEIVRQNPLVVLFYDIVSDEEAQIIQMLAVPKAHLVLLALYNSIVY
ncbi:hypothetical protein X798_07395 [Onchocerca flexuosa]|uniref:Uncharacterized protein n=1 Tax=Onchocerca flexuosa TaxID=387005 RepID=A0A238BJS3_9BILA|nr:hypothetical protein X798_07395 [Onchocerca flexuosa]